MGITAKELAKQLGLSEAAVSIAINNKPGVSTATRKRVIEAANKAGFDFSRRSAERDRIRGSLCFVIYRKSGAVVDDTPFFASLSEGISLACRKERFDLDIKYLYEDEELDEQLYSLKAKDFGGIILLATEMDRNSVKSFISLGIPLVVLDAYFETLSCDFVLIDNVQGAFLAASHLISRLHVQPGYLRSSYPIANFDARADGFYKAIRANGMSASRSVVHRLTPSQEGAYEDMKDLLASGETPCRAYFADNDNIAIGAMRAIKEAGYSIPGDVAIVGFDDLPVCEYLDPPLTTIEVPKQYMGMTAAYRLMQIIEGNGSTPLKIETEVRLKKRKSV